jgi:UDP-4-amino-4,6-dideoxy-N-acetyl-beta-L-altrosamine transaminase
MSRIIPYGKQEITEDDIAAVVKCLRSDYLTQGPVVTEFESAFAKFIGAKYAVAVNNATSALHLSAMALNVTQGQKILCTPNTFVASSNCILYCDGDVEFVDINPQTFCMDLDKLEEKLKAQKKGYYSGVVAVDFAGYPMDFERLRKLADQYELWIIEDACHAPGAKFKNQNGHWSKSGDCAFADLAVFSFHPVKHIATGEGGMITTNSTKLYEKIKLLRTHGIVKNPQELSSADGWWMEMKSLGMNYRMPDILCALGLSQLSRIEKNLCRRKEIAARYDNLLTKDVAVPYRPETVDHAFHLYVIQTDKRKELYEYLKSKGILTQVHYIPIYKQPYYIEKYGPQSLVNTENYYDRTLSLPMYHALTEADQLFVINQINQFYSEGL